MTALAGCHGQEQEQATARGAPPGDGAGFLLPAGWLPLVSSSWQLLESSGRRSWSGGHGLQEQGLESSGWQEEHRRRELEQGRGDARGWSGEGW